MGEERAGSRAGRQATGWWRVAPSALIKKGMSRGTKNSLLDASSDTRKCEKSAEKLGLWSSIACDGRLESWRALRDATRVIEYNAWSHDLDFRLVDDEREMALARGRRCGASFCSIRGGYRFVGSGCLFGSSDLGVEREVGAAAGGSRSGFPCSSVSHVAFSRSQR